MLKAELLLLGRFWADVFWKWWWGLFWGLLALYEFARKVVAPLAVLPDMPLAAYWSLAVALLLVSCYLVCRSTYKRAVHIGRPLELLRHEISLPGGPGLADGLTRFLENHLGTKANLSGGTLEIEFTGQFIASHVVCDWVDDQRRAEPARTARSPKVLAIDLAMGMNIGYRLRCVVGAVEPIEVSRVEWIKPRASRRRSTAPE